MLWNQIAIPISHTCYTLLSVTCIGISLGFHPIDVSMQITPCGILLVSLGMACYNISATRQFLGHQNKLGRFGSDHFGSGCLGLGHFG